MQALGGGFLFPVRHLWLSSDYLCFGGGEGCEVCKGGRRVDGASMELFVLQVSSKRWKLIFRILGEFDRL